MGNVRTMITYGRKKNDGKKVQYNQYAQHEATLAISVDEREDEVVCAWNIMVDGGKWRYNENKKHHHKQVESMTSLICLCTTSILSSN